jgi:hypothetical protein
LRLWTLHPRYLDAPGLVALWREALLARAVLRGRTIGYRHHPQLDRFRACRTPRAAINAYLMAVYDESLSRGYAFDASKLWRCDCATLVVTPEELHAEWQHLLGKLRARSPQLYRSLRGKTPGTHPLFRLKR